MIDSDELSWLIVIEVMIEPAEVLFDPDWSNDWLGFGVLIDRDRSHDWFWFDNDFEVLIDLDWGVVDMEQESWLIGIDAIIDSD